MKQKTDLQKLEALLGLDSMRVEIEIVYDYGKSKLRAKAQNVWVRFPNHLRVKGAVYSAEVRRGKADSFMTIGDISAVNEIAGRAVRASGK